MRRSALWLAAALTATPAVSWETVVQDIRGQRSVEMYGFIGPDAQHGIALICYPTPHGADTAIALAIPSTGDYSLVPVTPVAVRIGSLELDGELTDNDSTAAIALITGPSMEAVFAEIGRTTSLPVRIVGLGAEIEVPKVNWEESQRQFAQACGR